MGAFALALTLLAVGGAGPSKKAIGSAENGAVHNHAGVFYVHSPYTHLHQLLPGTGEADYRQLPISIPDYLCGGWRELPRTARRSPQLFNTSTVSSAYRCA